MFTTIEAEVTALILTGIFCLIGWVIIVAWDAKERIKDERNFNPKHITHKSID